MTLKKLARSGLTVRVGVAAASTKLGVTLIARLPKAKGRKAQTITLATLSKKAGVGVAKLHLVLKRAARTRVVKIARATVTVTVSATAPGTVATRLVRSSSLHR